MQEMWGRLYPIRERRGGDELCTNGSHTISQQRSLQNGEIERRLSEIVSIADIRATSFRKCGLKTSQKLSSGFQRLYLKSFEMSERHDFRKSCIFS